MFLSTGRTMGRVARRDYLSTVECCCAVLERRAYSARVGRQPVKMSARLSFACENTVREQQKGLTSLRQLTRNSAAILTPKMRLIPLTVRQIPSTVAPIFETLPPRLSTGR